MPENDWAYAPCKPATKKDLDALKSHPRASYDEVLRGLIAFWRRENGDKPVVLEEA